MIRIRRLPTPAPTLLRKIKASSIVSLSIFQIFRMAASWTLDADRLTLSSGLRGAIRPAA
jgi:hypothetical protein